ncbi:MAG: histone deacetylase [Gemmatimonadota bacterium]|nr:histone deacetylase [Gemmatimonadota bacterium]
MLRLWSTAHYLFPLPAGHRFPIEKYAMMRDMVIAEGIATARDVHDPALASREDLLGAHTPGYIDAVMNGTLSAADQRRIGLPWSPQLAERSLRATGATCEAALHAVRSGISMTLAGGTHHAFAGHGEGFCVFNDVVVATRMLQSRGLVRQIAVIDLDVHQGNGTHDLFRDDSTAFTFSMHGRNNYPFRKVAGSFDIELDDGIGDDEYLAALANALPRVLSESNPDLVFYLAGSDTHEGDRLGRMKLTFDGLSRRDVMVFESCREIGVPVVAAVAGGYGRNIADTVRVHVNTARIAGRYAPS